MYLAPLITKSKIMKLNSGIYCIENLVNGKCYIGASRNLKSRLYNHRSRLKNGKHKNKYLQASWNKYGESSFKMYSVELCEPDKKLLGQREKWWIDNMNVLDSTCGYNLSEIVYGDYPVKKTPEHKANIGQKSKEVMAAYLNRLRQSKERQIVVIDLITEEREYYDLPQDCPVKFGSNKGRNHFNFLEKKVKIKTYGKTEEQIMTRLRQVQKRYIKFVESNSQGFGKYTTVYKLNKKTLEHTATFSSLIDAAKDANTKTQRIRDCVSGLIPSYKGFIYTTDLDNVEPVNYSRKRKIYDNGVVYDSWKDYSNKTGLTKVQITLKLRSKNNPNIYWIETPTVKELQKSKQKSKSAPKSVAKAVIDNNGICYQSVSIAASTLNLKPKKIYEVLSGRANTTMGYSFQYA